MILTVILVVAAVFIALLVSGFGKNAIFKNPQGVSDRFLEMTMRHTGTILETARVGSPEWQEAGRKHEAAHREWRRRQGLPELVVNTGAAQPAEPAPEMPDALKGRWLQTGRAADDWHTLSDEHLNMGSGDERITSITPQSDGSVRVISRPWEDSDGDWSVRELMLSTETDELTDLKRPGAPWQRV